MEMIHIALCLYARTLEQRVIQSYTQSYISSKFRGETSYIVQLRTGSSRSSTSSNAYHRDSRALRVFVTRAADSPSLLYHSLSLSPSSPRSDGCYSTRSATFPRTKARKRGVVAWAGGQSYRGGWLAPVNGFRGQWRYTARSHGPSPKNYEPASTASFRGGRIFSLLALDLESRRRQKRKKRSRLRPRLPSRFFHVITISFSCFSIHDS